MTMEKQKEMKNKMEEKTIGEEAKPVMYYSNSALPSHGLLDLSSSS
jgi:hypothetical protein